jgi:hypothetical protein
MALAADLIFLSYPIVFPTCLVSLLRAVTIFRVVSKGRSVWRQLVFWSSLVVLFPIVLALLMLLTYWAQYLEGHGAMLFITPIWALPLTAWLITTVVLLTAQRRIRGG